MKKPLNMGRRPKDDPAENTVRNIGLTAPKPEYTSLHGEEGSISHKQQSLRYFEGRSKAGKGSPYYPSEINGMDGPGGGDPGKADYPPSVGQGNDLHEFVDRSTKKPYGRSGMGWAEKSGKLGDLDPQETDQPSWVGTWSRLQEGPNGAGPTRDENYPVQRPRTFSRQEERFEECNPEFQDVADHGDWTSFEWSEDV